jgi:hypothetical protein
LTGPATAQAQEGCADSVGTGGIEASVPLVLKKTKTNKNRLVHGNGLHLIKEPLETNGLKEGAAGKAGEQPPRGLDHRYVKKQWIVIIR